MEKVSWGIHPSLPQFLELLVLFFHGSLCGKRAGKPGDLSYWVPDPGNSRGNLGMVRMLLVLAGGMDKFHRAWSLARGAESFSKEILETRVLSNELDFTKQTEARAKGFPVREPDWTEWCKMKVSEGSQEWASLIVVRRRLCCRAWKVGWKPGLDNGHLQRLLSDGEREGGMITISFIKRCDNHDKTEGITCCSHYLPAQYVNHHWSPHLADEKAEPWRDYMLKDLEYRR